MYGWYQCLKAWVGVFVSTERVLDGPKFEMKDTSAREKVADRLESQAVRLVEPIYD
jgi:hypothetical protein